MWDLPRPGLEPVSPALAGRFSTTAPPGKPLFSSLNLHFSEFSFFKIYLFILFIFGCIGSWLQHLGSSLRHAGSSVVAPGLFIVVRGLLSSCGVWVFSSLFAARRFSLYSCGAQAPGCVASVVVARGFQSAWAL